jgi:hypothetical protein
LPGPGVGDLVVQQRVQLGGFGGGVAEAAADGLDGDASVDEFGGVGVAQLVDVDLDASLGAVALPAVVSGVIRQGSAPAVDGGAEQRTGGVAGARSVGRRSGPVVVDVLNVCMATDTFV